MVQSGLVNDVTVSHYRLSIHLSTAMVIISLIFWLVINIKLKKKIFFRFSFENLPFQFFLLLIFFQVIVCAFVSCLDAGKIYPTWPKMGDTFIPNDLYFKNISDFFNFDNHSLVQFYHRSLAYIIFLYVLILTFFIYEKKLVNLFKPVKILISILLLQGFLGIFTLVSGLNIFLASAHQITSVLLVFSALNLYYLRTK